MVEALLDFAESWQNDWILPMDSELTTGTSLVQIGKKLLELGALSVRGVFMAKTVRETEMSV